MQIDCYGFEATSQFFKRKELDAHLMKRVEGVLYVCFGGDAMRPIHRLARLLNVLLRRRKRRTLRLMRVMTLRDFKEEKG